MAFWSSLNQTLEAIQKGSPSTPGFSVVPQAHLLADSGADAKGRVQATQLLLSCANSVSSPRTDGFKHWTCLPP